MWLLPLFFLATLAVLFYISRRWKGRTEASLKSLRAELRRLQSHRRELDQALREHSSQDPEPYGSRIAQLNADLDTITAQADALERRWVEVKEKISGPTTNQWQVTAGAPYFWYLRQKEVDRLWGELEGLRHDLDSAYASGQGLAHLGWEVAQQARQVRQSQQDVSARLQALRGKNLRGDAIEQATRQEQEAQASLAQIPAHFFSGDEGQVLAEADKSSIAEAHARLHETEPVFNDLLAAAKTWEEQMSAAHEAVSGLRQSLDTLEQAIASAPANLALNAMKSHYDQLKVIADNLHATLSRLEVESILAVINEAQRTRQAAQEAETQIRRARQRLATLEQGITEVNAGLKQTQAEISELSKHPNHPVVWSQSRGQLNNLLKEAEALGAPKKPRSPEQVFSDLDAAARLNKQQKDLAAHCRQVAQQHAELLGLLASPDLSQGLEWCQKATRLAARLAPYDAENWPRSAMVTNLAADIQDMQARLSALVAVEPGQPIAEVNMPARLEETRQLAEAFKAFQERARSIKNRFDELQQVEKEAREQVEAARAALSQMAFIVRSNSFLTSVAGQELPRLNTALQQALDEMEERQRGPVERKARQAEAITGRIEQAANTWLDRLTDDIEGHIQDLSALTADLDAIGQVDEPPVADARKRMAEAPAHGSGYRDKAQYSLSDLVAVLKRRSDYWQSLVSTYHALDDLAQPVLDTYNDAEQSRGEALDLFSQLSGQMRGQRGWPPTQVNFNADRQELARLEDQWEGQKNHPAKAAALAGTLGSLAGKYQTLAERTRQTAARVQQEQDQVLNLENQIADLAQAWQTRLSEHRDSQITCQEIQDLLASIDQEAEQIRQSYRQGQRAYPQVLQALQALLRRVRIKQVTLDGAHVLDVNGRVL